MLRRGGYKNTVGIDDDDSPHLGISNESMVKLIAKIGMNPDGRVPLVFGKKFVGEDCADYDVMLGISFCGAVDEIICGCVKYGKKFFIEACDCVVRAKLELWKDVESEWDEHGREKYMRLLCKKAVELGIECRVDVIKRHDMEGRVMHRFFLSNLYGCLAKEF